MAKSGRKAFDYRSVLPVVEELAARGLNDSEICLQIGIHRDTFYKYKRRKTEFSDAIKKGRATAHETLVNVLFDAATKKKNLGAAMFLLKTQFGYRDSGPVVSSVDVEETETATITYQEIDGRKNGNN